MSRKSIRPGWKRWYGKKVLDAAFSKSPANPPEPFATEPLRGDVWVRKNNTTKAHRVVVSIHNIMSIKDGRPVTHDMSPEGCCPVSRKIEWVGLSIDGSSDWKDRCSNCSSLPKAHL